MSKLPYIPFVDDAFDRTYSEVYADDYLSGVRPEDPPRLGWFGIFCAVALFVAIGWVAAHIF